MKTINEIREEISSAEYEYRSAIAINAGISSAKDRLKNLLFAYRAQIIDALGEESETAERMEEYKKEAEMYYAELAAMDDENDELRHRIRELEAQIETEASEQPAKKKRAKTKATGEPKVMTAVVE